ncbi:MAG: hypothetical protein KGI47_06255 [Betaproteobacteria bacterium]|nr:hypothetical protein [Betaproteobacteria bacterium]MDE2621921.1 hypothetical protein [Betaproteobacteria bacterium]
MKKLLIAFTVIVAPFLAHAEAPVCQHYEHSELEGMTPDQLMELQANFTVTHLTDNPDLTNITTDEINCSNEWDRVNSVLNEKVAALLAPLKAMVSDPTLLAKRAAYLKTTEGKILTSMQNDCDSIKYRGIFYDDYGPHSTGLSARTSCVVYIMYTAGKENCNPDSENTPEDIECVLRAREDVHRLVLAEQKCLDDNPDTRSFWHGNSFNGPIRDACTEKVYQAAVAEAEAARAKWKALGYYPDKP